MASVRGKGCSIQRSQTFKALTGLLSYQSDKLDHENLIELNKLGHFEAPTPKILAPKALVLSLKALKLDVVQYIQKKPRLDHPIDLLGSNVKGKIIWE